MPQLSVGDLLIRRRRLQLKQNEAAKILRLNPGCLVDIEREVITPVQADLARLMAAYDDFDTRSRTRNPETTDTKK